jgi:orotate phosphoribosyltransferase
MRDYQKEFLDFAIETGVLRFGEFTLKSGRISPYFFNSGLFNTGRSLAKLGRFYAAGMQDAGLKYDVLFGPAYKGIPLVASIGIALADHYDQDVPYAFNRKEAKDHGEGGTIVGSELKGKVLIVDDVISAGTSVRESVDLIKASGAEPAGVMIALNRQEKGTGDKSAIQEVEESLGIPVASIVKLDDLLTYIKGQPQLANYLDAVSSYRDRYGA